MNKLIIRADDYGMSEAVSLGILSAYKNGIITCISMIVNLPYSETAAIHINNYSNLCIGLHTNLILGRPCSDLESVSSMIDENGFFISSKIRREQIIRGEEPYVYDEVYTEFNSQVEKFYELNGRIPNYIDSHAVLSEVSKQALIAIAKKWGIKFCLVRGIKDSPWTWIDQEKTQYQFYKNGEDGYKYLKDITKIIKDNNISILVTHPGFLDLSVLKNSTLTTDRVKDHEMLTDERSKKWIVENNIQLLRICDL